VQLDAEYGDVLYHTERSSKADSWDIAETFFSFEARNRNVLERGRKVAAEINNENLLWDLALIYQPPLK
jgi:hypothetical protein